LNFLMTCLIAVFIGGGIWFQQGNSQVDAGTILPSLFFQCVTQGIFGSLQVINTFPSERSVMLRERAAGTYYVSSYFLAKTATDFVFQLWPPILFTCVAYPMLYQHVHANKFFIHMCFLILDSMAATSLAVSGKIYLYVCPCSYCLRN
jgi:ATP-binding cassette subfamily G (WHITE) protein 2